MTTATFVTTMGSFTVRLMPEHAPKTVANFVGLARGGWNINDRLGRVAAPADGVTLDGWRLRGPHLQPTSHLSVDVEPFEGLGGEVTVGESPTGQPRPILWTMHTVAGASSGSDLGA